MARDNFGGWIVGTTTEIFNEKGKSVGIIDRNPATVFVTGDDASGYFIVDGFGNRVDSPKEELEKIKAQKKALADREAALSQINEVHNDAKPDVPADHKEQIEPAKEVKADQDTGSVI